MAEYQPKRKSYNSLSQLKEEMEDNNIKILYWDGAEIRIKGYSYGLYDSQINIKKEGETNVISI